MAKVRVKLAGMLGQKMVSQVYEEEVEEGIKLDALFKRLDKKSGWGKSYFKTILKLPMPPVLLINGEQAELKELKDISVKDGDEISLLMPMAGG